MVEKVNTEKPKVEKVEKVDKAPEKPKKVDPNEKREYLGKKNWNCEMVGERIVVVKGEKVELTQLQHEKLSFHDVV